jgi:hypothetical protein
MRRTPCVRGRIVNFNYVCRRAGAVIAADRVNLAVQHSGCKFLASSGHRRQGLPNAADLGRSAAHECEQIEQGQDGECLLHSSVQCVHLDWGTKALTFFLQERTHKVPKLFAKIFKPSLPVRSKPGCIAGKLRRSPTSERSRNFSACPPPAMEHH